jgi:hypothetical protein
LHMVCCASVTMSDALQAAIRAARAAVLLLSSRIIADSDLTSGWPDSDISVPPCGLRVTK